MLAGTTWQTSSKSSSEDEFTEIGQDVVPDSVLVGASVWTNVSSAMPCSTASSPDTNVSELVVSPFWDLCSCAVDANSCNNGWIRSPVFIRRAVSSIVCMLDFSLVVSALAHELCAFHCQTHHRCGVQPTSPTSCTLVLVTLGFHNHNCFRDINTLSSVCCELAQNTNSWCSTQCFEVGACVENSSKTNTSSRWDAMVL